MAAGDKLTRRPPREDGGRRGDQLNIRLSEGEMAALTGPAAAAGLKTGRWLVETGLAAAEAAQARTDDELFDQARHAAWLVREAIPADENMPDLLYAEVTALRAAALPLVLAEILKRPRGNT